MKKVLTLLICILTLIIPVQATVQISGNTATITGTLTRDDYITDVIIENFWRAYRSDAGCPRGILHTYYTVDHTSTVVTKTTVISETPYFLENGLFKTNSVNRGFTGMKITTVYRDNCLSSCRGGEDLTGAKENVTQYFWVTTFTKQSAVTKLIYKQFQCINQALPASGFSSVIIDGGTYSGRRNAHGFL